MQMLRSRTLAFALGLVAGTIPTWAKATFIDSNLAASATAHLNGGGCYPTPLVPGLLDMLTLIDPEWAAVDVDSHLPPLSDPVTIHGTVALAKVNEAGDFPGDHVTDDENTFITVDAADMGLVGTGNVHPMEGVEAGTLEVEWEIGKYPLFAWPGTGDRLTGVGRWIWDCGHPNPNPAGSCSTTISQPCAIDSDCASPTCETCVAGETCVGVTWNYHSEMHPPQALAVTRTGGYSYSKLNRRAGRLSTRTDVWISPDGGGAGDQCFLTHRPNPVALLRLECFPLSQPLANVNASDFAFDITLPPKPAGQTRPPRVQVFDQTPAGLPKPAVTTTWIPGVVDTIHAVVNMTTPVDGTLPSMVGKTIIARWINDPTPITPLRVRVTGIEILNPLKAVTPALPARQRCSVTTSQDCSVTPCPVGETCLTLGGPTPGWQVWFEVNGHWQQLPGLSRVQTPGTIPQNLIYTVGMPAGGTLHLHASGKSLACLEAQLYGQSIARDLTLYGLTDGATCLTDASKDIGRFDISLSGPDFGSGGSSMAYVTPSVGGDGGTCSITTTQLCVTDADCPGGPSDTCVVTGGSYKLHYTISKP